MTRSAETHPSVRRPIEGVPHDLFDFIREGTSNPSSGDGTTELDDGWLSGSRTIIAVPLFDAVKDIADIIDEVAIVARANPSWEFLFIDDGSSDGTVAAFNRRVAAINFVDPGTASRLGIIPSSPHAGLGHVARIAGIETDGDHLILLMPAFRGRWALIERLRGELQTQQVVFVSIASRAAWPIRAARALVAWALGAGRDLSSPPQAIAIQGSIARVLAERTAIRSHGFDIELTAIAQRLGWRSASIADDASPHMSGNLATIASGRDTPPLLEATAVLHAGLAIVARLALGLYRLEPSRGRSRSAPGASRRKAS